MPDYDGYSPIHRCTCGCGLVIGDGDWASGRRSHIKVMPRAARYGAARRLPSARR